MFIFREVLSVAQHSFYCRFIVRMTLVMVTSENSVLKFLQVRKKCHRARSIRQKPALTAQML